MKLSFVENGRDDVLTDRVAIISSVAARLDGHQRANRMTVTSVNALAEGE